MNAVKEMLKHPDYLFLFLLDGVNEILRDTSPDDRIYSVLADQIGEMMEEYPDTVNFILSTRTGCSVFDSESLEEKFTQLTICGFDRNKLEKFLPTELADDLLENLLKTPMLLYLYRQIRTEQPEKNDFTEKRSDAGIRKSGSNLEARESVSRWNSGSSEESDRRSPSSARF